MTDEPIRTLADGEAPACSLVVVAHRELDRGTLRGTLSRENDFDVLATACCDQTARREMATLQPDIVVIDVEGAEQSAFELVHAVAGAQSTGRRPRAVVIVSDLALAEPAVAAGAAGVVSKDMSASALVQAIRSIAHGFVVVPEMAVRHDAMVVVGVSRASAPTSRPFDQLSERERDVLCCLARGLSNSEIGERLNISGGTVRSHVQQVLRKLMVRDRVQATVYAYEAGYVRAGDPDAAYGPQLMRQVR